MELFEKLKLLRHSYDYSKAYVAYKLNINLNDYIKIEAGEKPLTLAQLNIVTELYQLEAAELIAESEDCEDADWEVLLTEKDGAAQKESCEETIANLKTELNSIKSILYALADKLGVS